MHYTLQRLLAGLLLMAAPATALQAQHNRLKAELTGRWLFPNNTLNKYNNGGVGASLTFTKPFKTAPSLWWNLQAGADQFIGTKLFYTTPGGDEMPTTQSSTFIHLSAGFRYYIIPRIYVQQNLGLARITKTGSDRVGFIYPGWQTTLGVLPLKWLAVQASAFGFKTVDDALSSFAVGLALRF